MLGARRSDYPDDDPRYYARGPPQQAPAPSRRRPPQDPGPHYLYHRHRDDRDRDSWVAPSPAPDIPPQLPRRQSSTTMNSASDYGVRPRAQGRRGRSSSASRLARSKSSSPRRYATPLPAAPPMPQLTLDERETLARHRLQTTFESYVFNTLPTHLLRVTDMTLLSRDEMWEIFKPRIESLSDSHLAKLLLEQDEEARKLGVSVIDPEVLTPFTEYVRTTISFAVFSHRWGSGEPLFHDLPNKRLQVTRRSPPSGPGYQKLLKFCEKARTDYGCEYVWSDTCCINKESSTELEEAILSMGVWYSEAGVCIVHLGNSSTLDDIADDPWFTRGWTLQELLLPRKIRFYGRDWSPICRVAYAMDRDSRREERTTSGRNSREELRANDKDNESVIATISKATGIPESDIRRFVPSCTRVAEKMRWASKRTTARVEDMAYSLLGLFDVTMPIAYGDGARAFFKLMGAIAEECTEPDFFAWAGKPSQWSLALPSSAQCYGQQAHHGELVAPQSALGDPAFEFSKLGLRTRLVLVPAYCEPLEPTDALAARFLLTPALAAAQEAIQIYVPHAVVAQPSGVRAKSEYEHDPRYAERDRDVQGGAGRGREFVLGVVDYDARAGPPGYAALHAGRVHLCLVLERERRGWGWVRVAKPGTVSMRFRESELFPIEGVCLVHRAQ